MSSRQKRALKELREIADGETSAQAPLVARHGLDASATGERAGREFVRAVGELVRVLLTEQFGSASFPWIPASTLGFTAKVARTLSREHGVRRTQIGRRIFLHVDDLRALAERNASSLASDATQGIAADVASAFARGGK